MAQGLQTRTDTPSTIPVPKGSHLLSPEELESYHRDGFVVPKFRLSDDEIARLKALLLRLVAENPSISSQLMNSPHIPGSGEQGLKSFPGWMEFASHPKILDIAEQIIGPDIILRGTAAFYKKAESGGATQWHRDAAGQPINPFFSISCWIAATDTYRDNACLRFIPGTHKKREFGKQSYNEKTDKVFGLTLDESEYDESKAVDIEIEAGKMIFFDVFTVHASTENEGKRERASYSLRLMPATSRFDHDATLEIHRKYGYYGFHSRPLVLVRGVNRAGNDLTRGHPKESASQEVARD